jgi:hypothetical protein
MSKDIKNHLDQYIQQDLLLLDQISQLRGRGNIDTEIGKTAITEGAAAIAASLFESSLAGRLGRKLTRSALDQQQRNQFLNQQSSIENQHNSLVRGVRDFLSSVSIRRKNLQEANSYLLIGKLDLAQDFLRPFAAERTLNPNTCFQHLICLQRAQHGLEVHRLSQRQLHTFPVRFTPFPYDSCLSAPIPAVDQA